MDGYFNVWSCFDLIVSINKHKEIEISLTGLWTKQVEISIPPQTQFFGVRFRLLSAEYILQQKISSFCNSEQKMPGNVWQLDKASFEKPEPITFKLDRLLLSILGSGKGIDKRKRKLFDLLNKTKGEQTVAAYLKQVFWESRQINRYFTEWFGVSLKAYCNIVRCHAFLEHIKKGHLYPEQNYFDRPHFIRELKNHTGAKPTVLFENKNDRFIQLATMTEK